MLDEILIREFVFRRIMKLNKWIGAKKKANELYFYKGHNEVKEGQPNKFKCNWSKESKEICAKSKSNSD